MNTRILDAFPCSREKASNVRPSKVVPALKACLSRWQRDLEDKRYPDEEEANGAARQLVILGLSLIHPPLVEVVPPEGEQEEKRDALATHDT